MDQNLVPVKKKYHFTDGAERINKNFPKKNRGADVHPFKEPAFWNFSKKIGTLQEKKNTLLITIASNGLWSNIFGSKKFKPS